MVNYTEPVAMFKGFVGGMRTNIRGQLLLTIVVPNTEKYDAMPVTDQPGLMLAVVCARVPRMAEDDLDGESDGD